MQTNPTRRGIVLGGLALGADFVLFGGCQGPNEMMATATWHGAVGESPPPANPPYYPNYSARASREGPGLVENGLGKARVYSAPRPAPRTAPQPAPRGEVIARGEWTTSRPNAHLADPMDGVQRITVHHSAIPSAHLSSADESVKMLQSIRNGHLGNGWADIGYHYIIDPSGRIWEGRPVSLQGAHVRNQNEHNLGVMLMGNFETERPTPAALAALDRFVAGQMRRYGVPVKRVYTHRELGPTACPGRSLQGYMLATRRADGRLAQA